MARKSSKTASGPSSGTPALTLIDVAKVAGVSPITVSRALHRPDIVSEAAREKVLAAVKATGYVPNMLAGGLASNKSRLVAIFLPTIAHSIFADTVQALIDQLTASGYQTMIGLTGYSPEQEEQLLAAVLGRRPDGIVLTGTLHTEESRDRLSRSSIPVVEAWELGTEPIDMQIGFSHEAVGRAMADYLYGKGYRQFGLVSVDDIRALKRGHALLDQLASLGITDVPVEIMQTPATLLSGREGLRQLKGRGSLPEVVVCSSDTVAQGILAEAASQGIKVPEELAVLGFGDLSSAAHVYPALSTVNVDGARMGKLIAKALLARFQNPDQHTEPVQLDTGFTIVERSTT
ncbi:LacI family DNA-binding transcriptional regulator [Pseudomonas sp. LTJR-52]|uniref:LacI family DNA-binding transcriptional regulator n=1 Tax=Pseudomonas sp. LTJR-52 TaxID=2479392 RepID=UPI000EFCE84E|nr:LacI family DNA-binding transcriptional regulator [Pseudomonas sp. LTJR-52]AYN96362.1 LacI family DNA-binding transcriptional regulator [Pseudomonas sp. LTJR-52]